MNAQQPPEPSGSLSTDSGPEETVSQGELERLFSLLPVLICISGTDGFFRRVNAEFTRVLGWSEAELLSIPYNELVHPEDRAATVAAVDRQAFGAKELAFENRYRCKDGSYRWLCWESNPVESQGFMYAIARDVTEHRLAQQEVRAARDEATRANQAKNEFLSRMSHELRTPLSAILGFAQLMQLDERTSDDEEAVNHIIRAGNHLLSLINEVLDISRIDSRKLSISLEPVALNEVVDEVVRLMEPLARGAEIGVEVVESDLRSFVRADRQRLKQVLLNLLSNAIKYNRHGGRVEIRWESLPEDRVVISISDTGNGIPPDRMDRLFEAFDRLGAESTGIEGTGLGLALSRALTEAMGGALTARSVLGEGSAFAVELAADAAPLESLGFGAPDLPVRNESAVGARKVLYVEDNLANLALVSRLVALRPGIHLMSAGQGRLGLELASQHRPDLVLLDLHLPDMEGDLVLAALKSNPMLASVPVIIASADATPGQVERLRAAGAHAYLTKPIDVREFLALLDATLAGQA